jgi:hypothetical protein
MRASLRLMARARPVPPNFRAVRESALGEFLKQLVMLLRCHADASIADGKLDPIA